MKSIAIGMTLFVSTFAMAQDWVDITPGGPTSSWVTQGGEWEAAGGVLSGKAGTGETVYYMSDMIYADFEFECDVLVAEGAMGGVVFRGHILPVLPIAEGTAPADAPKTVYGYVFQGGAVAGEPVVQLSGSLHHADPVNARQSAIDGLAPGEWVKVSVKAEGEDVTVKLNGMEAVTGEDTSFSKGSIGFAVTAPDGMDNGSIQVRNVRVKDHGRAGEWAPLFNGQNFDEWTIWGTEEWAVEDGVIVGRSGPAKSEGYLATNQTWKDFHVYGTFKMLGEGNYGLFFHSTIAYDDKQYPVITGVQGEVEPSYPGSTGCMYESYKRGWLVEPDHTALGAFALRPGEWNEIEIKSDGNRRLSWVNGVNVMDWTDPAPNVVEGSFALQLHAGGVHGIMWKDLYVAK